MTLSRTLTLAALSAMPFLASANPIESRQDTCSTAPIQCCQNVEPADSPAATSILNSIGVVVQDVNVLVGLTCTPITVIGVGTPSSCSANTVCCEDNSHGGLVSIGCVPVSA